jgi:hypothetical protein
MAVTFMGRYVPELRVIIMAAGAAARNAKPDGGAELSGEL